MAAETAMPGGVKGSQIQEQPTERRAGSTRRAGLVLLATLIAAMLAAAEPASAADLSWSTNPSNGDYHNGGNWDGATVPGSGDAGVFGTSSTTSLFLSAPVVVSGWAFSGPANFTVDTNGQELNFIGKGIVVNGGGVTLNVTDGSAVFFQQDSSSGSATINIDGSSVAFGNVSGFQANAGTSNITLDNVASLRFWATSSAANATIAVNSASAVGFGQESRAGAAHITLSDLASTLTFDDNSSADNATIITNAGATVAFSGNSTAGKAAITSNSSIVRFQAGSRAGAANITLNSGPSGPAVLNFLANSSAENSVIAAHASTFVQFNDASKAGASTINIDATGGVASILGFFDNSSTEKAKISITAGAAARFEDDSKASSANIVLNGGPAGGATLEFVENSSAENAVVTAGGANASVSFFDQASGGDARFIMDADSTFSIAGLTITGTMAGSIEGAGSFDLGNKTLTVGSNNLSTEVSGTIDGAGGSLVKIGTGTLTLSGANTFTGDTVVQAGILEMNTSSHTSHARVDGGVLAGNGEFGAAIVGPGGLEVNAGGTVAPGPAAGGIGTLTVNGHVVFQPGSHFRVDVNAAGQSDRLVAQFGTVNLTGAVLDVMAANGKYAPSTDYLIIDNSGSDAVTGTFASLNSSLAFLTPTVSTTGGDGNDVVLTMTRNATVFRDVAITPNQAAVATALDQGPIDSSLVLALLNQTEAGARQAFDALSGEVHATVAGVLVNDGHFMRDAILARLVQAHHSAPGPTSFAALGATGPTAVAAASEGAAKMSLGMGPDESAAASRGSGLAFWSQGFGSWGNFDGDGNAAAADRTLGGFVSGVDGHLGGGWRIGIAAGYTQSDTSVDARLSQADVDSYHLAAYAGGRLGAFALRAGAAWAWHDVKTKRTIAFPGFLERAEASYDGDTGHVFAELALPFVTGKSALEPFAGLAYVHVSTDGFTENGGIAALTSRGTDQDVGYSRLGLRAAASMSFGSMHIVPYASAAWLHAFSDVTPDVALAFASPTSFAIAGAPVARDSALLEAGVALHLAPGATLGLSYQGQLGNDVEDHGVSGRLDWRF